MKKSRLLALLLIPAYANAGCWLSCTPKEQIAYCRMKAAQAPTQAGVSVMLQECDKIVPVTKDECVPDAARWNAAAPTALEEPGYRGDCRTHFSELYQLALWPSFQYCRTASLERQKSDYESRNQRFEPGHPLTYTGWTRSEPECEQRYPDMYWRK